jgi:predicted unusual protein kinase regulating ubiquinone biosynthesis (AarF/ABC1/UbiB family)
MIRRGRLARLATLGGLATGLLSDAAGATAHRVTHTADAAAAELHRRAARRMFAVLGEMKGLPLKAGQMLSYINEFVPSEHRGVYAEILGNLQTHTPTLPFEDVQSILAEEYQGRELADVFASFDREPIAAASIGQVYAAVLLDGTEVVVKVQYPGIREAMKADLANGEALASMISAMMPGQDLRPFIHDIMRRVEDECDYALELQNQVDFRDRWLDHPDVVIPRAYPALSGARVLVSERLHGAEWAVMLQTADTELKSRYGQAIFSFVFRSLFFHGMFNGDPHPGNYLFYPDGRVGFIDYGCVQRFDETQALAFQHLRDVVLEGSEDRVFREAIQRVFKMPRDLDPEIAALTESYLRLVFQPVTDPQPFRFTLEYTQELLRQMVTLKNRVNIKMIRGKTAYPMDMNTADGSLVFLGRIIFGMASVLTSLEAEGDFRALLAASWEQALVPRPAE